MGNSVRAVQPAAVHCCGGAGEHLQESCLRTHHKGEPVSLKPLSKDSHLPSVCKVMPGTSGDLTAEGDSARWSLACFFSGTPHQYRSPSPSGLPAFPQLHMAEPYLDGAVSLAGAARGPLHGR